MHCTNAAAEVHAPGSFAWAITPLSQLTFLCQTGGSIPVVLTFADNLGVNVLLLPMGRGDDGAQYALCSLDWGTELTTNANDSSTNEKLDLDNYINGVGRFYISTVCHGSSVTNAMFLRLDQAFGYLPLRSRGYHIEGLSLWA